MADESGGYFRGVVTGLLFGAAAALLLTPGKSGEVRQKLSEGAAALKDKASDLGAGLGTDDTQAVVDTDSAHQATQKAREAAAELDEADTKSQAHDVVDSV
jgi:gas vesicle protein